jgi:hypothetical protein
MTCAGTAGTGGHGEKEALADLQAAFVPVAVNSQFTIGPVTDPMAHAKISRCAYE